MTDITKPTLEPLLPLARQQMRGLSALEAAIPAVQQQLRDVLSSAPVQAGMDVDLLADELLAGKPLPDLGAVAYDAERKIRARNLHVTALQQLIARLQERYRDTHVKRADDALRFLAAQLDQVLAAARKALPDLDEVSDAQTAIEAGAVDAWLSCNQIAAMYDEIREAQRIIVSGALYPADGPRAATRAVKEARSLVDCWGTVRNYPERYGPRQHWEQHVTAAELDGAPVDHGTATGPAAQTPAPPPWFAGGLTALRFMVSPQVAPWLPTLAELQAVRTSHSDARVAAATELARTH